MNKPVYGTKDAGRSFYKTLRRVAVAAGLQESRLCRSLYAYRKDGRVVLLLGAHVDDIIWAAEKEHDTLVTKNLFKHFEVNKTEEGKFRFCGASTNSTMISVCMLLARITLKRSCQ